MALITDLYSLMRWDDIRYFLEVAEAGSLNSAAKRLGVNQTTVGRRIRALEARLGADLFDRHENRSTLTIDGKSALADAQRMADIASSFARNLRGANGRLVGEVRLNMTEGLAAYWLFPRLEPFQKEHSELAINWFLSNSMMDLDRECDLAIWWQKPRYPRAVVRKLGSCKFSLFATRSYVDAYGLPERLEDLADHQFVHFNDYEKNPGLSRWCDLMKRYRPLMRLDNTAFTSTIFKSGRILTLLADYSVHVDPTIVKAPLDLDISLDIWLAYHETRRKSARVRALADEIVRLFEKDKGAWFRK